MCRGSCFIRSTTVQSVGGCYFVVTFLMCISRTVGDDDDTTTSMTHGLIQCEMSNGVPDCKSPYLMATIFIFLILTAVIIGQCVILLYQSRTRHRKGKRTIAASSDDDCLYSDINQAEFLTSLSGKLERNDSIGSSSLNFLSPGGCPSAKSLSNVSSLSDSEDRKARVDLQKRHDTVIYTEINTKRYTVVPMNDAKTSVSSMESRQYDFIKSLSLEGGKRARPSTYCEIPLGKNGILRHQTTLQGDDGDTKPFNVQAEVHTSPVGRGDPNMTSIEEENGNASSSSERPATYIEVFADDDDYKEYIASMRRSPDENKEHTPTEEVSNKDRLEVGTVQTRGRVPTYLSVHGDSFGLGDVSTHELNCSDGNSPFKDEGTKKTNGTLLPPTADDVKVFCPPDMV